jgi:hypothetical protein
MAGLARHGGKYRGSDAELRPDKKCRGERGTACMAAKWGR